MSDRLITRERDGYLGEPMIRSQHNLIWMAWQRIVRSAVVAICCAAALTSAHAADPQPTPTAEVRDVILMLDNKPEPAAERFAAASNEEPGAVASFHLAHAYHALNRPRDAKDALADARRLRLRPADFHPLEQPTLARVAKEIDAR